MDKTKILIVEANPRIQGLIIKMLSYNGHRLEIASDGFELGVKVMTFKPGLIILDLFMPGMDGFGLCKRIKENPDTSHVKILAILDCDTRENRDRIMAAGADAYLAKPVKSHQLIEQVKVLLNGKG